MGTLNRSVHSLSMMGILYGFVHCILSTVRHCNGFIVYIAYTLHAGDTAVVDARILKGGFHYNITCENFEATPTFH